MQGSQAELAGPPLARRISELRIARTSHAKLVGPPFARHLRAQNCERVSGETGWTASRAATRRPNLRGCLRRNWPDHLRQGISEPSVARLSRAKLAGPPLARYVRTHNYEDVSGDTGRARCISEPRNARTPPAKLAGSPRARYVGGEFGWTTSGQDISDPRLARMSQATLAAQAPSPSPEMRGRIKRNWLARHLTTSQEERSGPPQVRASLSPEQRGCFMRNWPENFARYL